MKNKKSSDKSVHSLYANSKLTNLCTERLITISGCYPLTEYKNLIFKVLDSNLSDVTGYSSKLSHQLLTYYKEKSLKLEKELSDLLKVLDKVKSACDYSNDLQAELSIKNEEVSKLQKVIGDLQIHLFREKELNLKLSAENDQLKIEDYKNKKKINLLLMASGTSEKKYLHFVTSSVQGKFVPTKLPPKLQKLKEMKQKELIGENKDSGSDKDIDPQVLLLNNQLLASELEHHIKLSREQINMLLKEKEISDEERSIERQRLQKEIDVLAAKLKEAQDLLCETTEKLVKYQQVYEREKSTWMEEKDKYSDTINMLKNRLGGDVVDLIEYSSGKARHCDKEGMKDHIMEKQQIAALYQEQILNLQAEVNRLRERAQVCRATFKDKTEKMTAQVAYLKNKYEDLDRRRQLEAEGFRTDIRMLKERLKELEKKLAKASSGLHITEQQQLLVSARNTLNRAKQLEKELAYMKSKISALESTPEHDS